ncbi:MAG: hypothetical protein SGPRY_011125 [Prymnesium sp.]
MNQHGCEENDPNGPVFDPVHGVIHLFYQNHISAPPGHGPIYGHFVSKNFLDWAPMPIAIWNGLDVSALPYKKTLYDEQAIFTGSAAIVDGAGPKGAPGIVQIYPGICKKEDWPGCETGTLLAQAIPANYANDELLTNWTKPTYNPVMENTQRDPSSPWKTPSGEWRLRTYDSKFYGAASDADLLKGKWWFERAYELSKKEVGTYIPGAPRKLDIFSATPGFEDMWAWRRIDVGHFYASKVGTAPESLRDNEYPTLDGSTRRINWGWAVVPPKSAQTLPREITFNVATHTLEQRPIDELVGLRASEVSHEPRVFAAHFAGELNRVRSHHLNGGGQAALDVSRAVTQSELVVTYALPSEATKLGALYTASCGLWLPLHCSPSSLLECILAQLVCA